MTEKIRPVFTREDVALVAAAAVNAEADVAYRGVVYPSDYVPKLFQLATRMAVTIQPKRRVRKPKVTP